MFVKKESVGDADLAKGFSSGNFGTDAGALLALGGIPHPVVPVAPRPLHPQLPPQI